MEQSGSAFRIRVMPLTAAEIAKQIDGEVLGDDSVELTGFAPADKAKPGDLTFAENQTYFNRAEQSAAEIGGPGGDQLAIRIDARIFRAGKGATHRNGFSETH